MKLLETVGLEAGAIDRYPHEFSGGQRQRIGITPALALQPQLAIADEPVSALDGSIQLQILNLFVDLRKRFRLSYLFISHDLAVIEHMSDEIAVMHLGAIVETVAAADLFARPSHPYAEGLISAVPHVDGAGARKRIVLRGEMPNPEHPPPGCPFHTRCPQAMEVCAKAEPPLTEIGAVGRPHEVRCHLFGGDAAKGRAAKFAV